MQIRLLARRHNCSDLGAVVGLHALAQRRKRIAEIISTDGLALQQLCRSFILDYKSATAIRRTGEALGELGVCGLDQGGDVQQLQLKGLGKARLPV